MDIIRSRDFVGSRARDALDITSLNGITTHLALLSKLADILMKKHANSSGLFKGKKYESYFGEVLCISGCKA